MGVALKGLAWDHRRCWGPLDAGVGDYLANHPEIDSITWDRRSLYEFGEGRLDLAVQDYDLVIYDHPFVGEIARDGLMLPFDPYLSAADARAYEADSVGASWRSYQAEGKQWGLPIDAAAQVAAYRPDLLRTYTDRPPRTHDEVLDLGRNVRADNRWLVLPLVPTDAICLILTGAAMAGKPVRLADGVGLDSEVAEAVVDRFRAIAALSHPDSWSLNPISCCEHMIRNDDVVYTPFAFGYVNYTSRTETPHLLFADIPSTPPVGALLGGAGVGVSAFSKNPDAAAAYALHLFDPEVQRGVYVREGGQPGSLSAWTDPEANRLTRDFFADTLATLQGAYLRDTMPGFIPAFREGTHKAVAAIRGDLSARELVDWFNAAADRLGPVSLDRSVA
ncbi:extracellular solute-binding protein [Bauldia sp.]|uniref:extracellular solute-binding protein n=1 Tax=Bauldia sp. TaxID=2575872 RepID=UPI003BAA820A